MKMYLKLIAAFIALLMLATSFISCSLLDDSTEENEDESKETVSEAIPENIEKNNYNKEFYLSVLPDTNPIDYYWVEKSEGDAMSEAVYARQEKIYKDLGVEIIGKSAGSYRDYAPTFKTAVMNKDGSVDTILTHVSTAVASFVSEMYLQNIEDVPGVDLDQDYWNRDFMDSISIADNYFLGFSNFNILYTYVIAFNKDMMDQYAGSMEKSVYELVEDYEWTLDEMLALAQLVSSDRTADGKTEDDTFGLTGQQWVPWIGFLHASNINLVEMNEKGEYAISVMNSINSEKTADLVQKLKDFSASKYGFFEFPSGSSIAQCRVPLTTGRTLMQLTSTYSLNSYLDYEITFGVLPYPMYDTAQKDVGYRSLQWGGYIGVPSYLNDPQMVGETLELLAFYSDDVMITFYEKMLGKQVADVPEDRKMLDIVWASVCTDFGQTYGEECSNILYFLPHVTWPDGGKELVSYLASFERTSNRSLMQFVKIVEKKAAAK